MTLPFVTGQTLPVVEISVDGSPAHVIVDTIAPELALSSEFLRSHGKKILVRGRYESEPLSISVGGDILGRIQAQALPRALLPPGKGIDGAIGTAFLMRFRSTIDYPRHILLLASKNGTPPIAQAPSVPMRVVGGGRFLFVQARVNGTLCTLSVDTVGSVIGIHLTSAALVEAHLHGTPFSTTVSLGVAMTRTVAGRLLPEGDQLRAPFRVDGSLAPGFLNHYAVTLDFVNHRLILQ